MKRVKEAAVVREGAAYFLLGAPFDGIVYQSKSKDTCHPVAVAHGAIDFTADFGGGFNVDLRDLTGEVHDAATGEATLIQVGGSPFTGFACEFVGDFCNHEFECVAGNIVADRWWNTEGKLLRLIDNKEVQRDYEWDPDGILRRASIGIRGKCKAMAGYTEEGRLQSLILRGRDIWSVPLGDTELRYFPLLSASATTSLRIDQTLALSGDQITDEVLERIIPAMRAANLRQISLRDTALNARGIESVMSTPSLVTMRIDSSRIDQEGAVRKGMKDHPDLQVELHITGAQRQASAP